MKNQKITSILLIERVLTLIGKNKTFKDTTITDIYNNSDELKNSLFIYRSEFEHIEEIEDIFITLDTCEDEASSIMLLIALLQLIIKNYGDRKLS